MTITIRRGDVGVFDFIQKMESHHFKTNLDHQLRGLFISDKSNFYGEEQLELGIGRGPLNDMMSMMLEKIVLPRLSIISIDGTIDTKRLGLNADEMDKEMFSAGVISGTTS